MQRNAIYMKRILLAGLLAQLSLAPATAQTLDRSVRPKAGPAPEIKLGDIQSFTLDNGMKVFVVENHKMPTVTYSIQLDIKPELEGEMAGARDMMSELLLSGTTTRSKDKLDEEIDFIGADISASDAGLNGNALRKHQVKLLELMSDIAQNTQIRQEELDKVQKRMGSALQSDLNDPDAMLRNASGVANFTALHPYGEVSTEESVKKVTLSRVTNYYNTYFRPNVAYMAIVGDITMAEVKPLVTRYFGGWKRAEVPSANYIHPTPPAGARVVFVPREAAVQSVFSVTYPVDMKPGAPDAIKASVANTVLGGGSQGRLFLNLRERHGWTYGAYSGLRQDDLIGTFSAGAKCRNIVTDSSIQEMLTEMSRMRNEQIDNDVLQRTIAYISGNFAISLEDPKRVAQFAINIDRYKMPKDYYQNYLKNLAAVTAADVQSAARTYIHPEQANIVVVGSKTEVAPKLTRFDSDGQVEYVDNYGRPVKMSSAEASDLTAAQIRSKYISAIGGPQAINGLKDMKIVSEGEIQGIKISITELKKSPGSYRQEFKVNGTPQQFLVFNGEKGYQTAANGQKTALTGSSLEDARSSADLQSDLHPEKYHVERTAKEISTVDGNRVYVVESKDALGKQTTEYYDATSFLLLKQVKTEGDQVQALEFADYRVVPGTNGYKMPYQMKIPAGPVSLPVTVTSVEVNKNISETEFK